MGDRPTGTVTFLFTDIEGSTQHWEQDPEVMPLALELHDEAVRTTIESGGGYVFATGGDGFAAAFTRASDAAEVAIAVQRRLASVVWPTGRPVRARIGLHTGEAVERGGDYFGPAVNRAARLAAAGHGGQVVLSVTTASLVGATIRLEDLGEHRLRDIPSAMRVYQLAAEGLAVTFPPLRSRAPGNLPATITPLVGRAPELAELADLLARERWPSTTSRSRPTCGARSTSPRQPARPIRAASGPTCGRPSGACCSATQEQARWPSVPAAWGRRAPTRSNTPWRGSPAR
jgi:class 3 adenylate cyclase